MTDEIVIARWTVIAGDIPGVPISATRREWSYSADDWESDKNIAEQWQEENLPGAPENQLSDMMLAASEYAFTLVLTHNWVDLKFTRVPELFPVPRPRGR